MKITRLLQKIILSVFLGLVAGLQLKGNDYQFKKLGVSDGLSGSEVNAILKDSQGFMWFGTSSGLSRFDGYSIKRYISNFTDASALPDSYIETIQEAADGNLWIKTSGGYVILDPRTDMFQRSVSQYLAKIGMNLDPDIVHIDKQKNMWVYAQGKGCFYYKSSMQLIYPFEFNDTKSGIPEGIISSLIDADEGVVAVYTDGRLVCMGGEQQRILWQMDYVAKKTGVTDRFDAFVDSEGNLGVYGSSRMFFYDKSLNQWYNSLPELGSRWGNKLTLFDDVVTSVAQDAMGRVWVGTNRQGLILVDPKARTLETNIRSTDDARALGSDNIKSVYADNANIIWVGTQKSGISYWAKNIYKFDIDRVGDVTGISEDKAGNLWLATYGRGLLMKNISDGSYQSFTKENGLNDNSLRAVLAAKDGSVWIGTNRHGLNRMKNGQVTSYYYEPGQKTGLQNNYITSLQEDNFGNIWIGTYGGGLQCLNAQTGVFANFNVANGKLPSNYVTSLFLKNSQLIIGTSNGISVLNLSNNQFNFYLGTASGDKHFTNNNVTQVLMDSRGLIWIGTRDGLNILDTEADRLHIFTMEDGLPNNVICGLAEDKHKNIWLTTNNGATSVVVQTNPADAISYNYYLYNYGVSEGLQGPEFNMSSITSTRRGDIYMGGVNGLNWLNQGKTEEANKITKVLFTSLYIDDVTVNTGRAFNGRILLSEDINSIKKIALKYDENSFVIQFATNNYNRSDHTQFVYQLEGLSEDWNTANAMLHGVKFENLPSGSYILHVKAVDDKGVAGNEVHSLEIEIGYPLWMSWWAIGLYVVALVFVLLLFKSIIPQIRNLYKRQHKELEALKERKEELENVATELRTPVVAMIPVLKQMQQTLTDEEQKENMLGLHYNAMQMLAKLNELRGGLDKQEFSGVTYEEENTDTQKEYSDSTMNAEADHENKEVVETMKYLVYIIDSNADMVEFIEDCLKSTYQVRAFTNTQEAWEVIQEEKPDLIICAAEMEGMSGNELCEKIKNERSLERVPFVVMTEGVLSQAELTLKKITLMADDYVAKPFNLKSIVIRCNLLLGEEVSETEITQDETMINADAMLASMSEQLRASVDQYVIQNISRKDLSVEEMSQVLNMSRTLLYRKVERITGKIPADYIRQIRIVEAAKLLSSDFITPAEVAEELGFGNLAIFSRYFQAEYGVTPSAYQENKVKNN